MYVIVRDHSWREVSNYRFLMTWDLHAEEQEDPSLRKATCWRTLQGLLPETCCFLLDFFLDLLGTCTFLLPKTGHAAADLPLSFCPGLSEHCATGPLLDPGGDYPHFTQFLPRSIFSIARLPFPITLNHPSSSSSSSWLRFVINWLDQQLNRCFLISRSIHISKNISHTYIYHIHISKNVSKNVSHHIHISHAVYIYQRTSSPSYKLEWDRDILEIISPTPC